MKSNFLKLLLLSCIAIFSTSAWALRCGTNLVDVGDSKAKVLQYCGKPVSKEKTKERIALNDDNGITISTVDTWTYNFGPTEFLYEIHFAKGKVAKITTDGYGY